MPVPVLPNALADGTLALGSEVRANDDTIVAILDHGLTRDNFPASGADIPGTVISATPGEGIPENRINDDAVTAAKLKDDPSAGSPGAAVATANHVKDGILNGKKLVNATVGSDKLKILAYEWDPTETSLGPVSAITHYPGLTAANVIPICCYYRTPSTPGLTTILTANVHLDVGANAWVLSLFNPLSGTTVGISGVIVRFVYISIAST